MGVHRPARLAEVERRAAHARGLREAAAPAADTLLPHGAVDVRAIVLLQERGGDILPGGGGRALALRRGGFGLGRFGLGLRLGGLAISLTGGVLILLIIK